MKAFVAAAIAALCLCGCGKTEKPAPIDRHTSPEAALAVAKAALERRDIGAFVDTLTDGAVRKLMEEAVRICLTSLRGALADPSGIKPSTGCDEIMRRYGWPGGTHDPSSERYQAALVAITDPRALTGELEQNHDKTGAGTSFVWSFLQDVSLSEVAVEGDRAHGKLNWDGRLNPVYFERDSTGWRFDPLASLAGEAPAPNESP
jgi:hypothetical protein